MTQKSKTWLQLSVVAVCLLGCGYFLLLDKSGGGGTIADGELQKRTRVDSDGEDTGLVKRERNEIEKRELVKREQTTKKAEVRKRTGKRGEMRTKKKEEAPAM